ncbi:MAG: hypothetical protein M1831_004422 [Alyxoria varia]|nr:MAG: hypothetical protein M1831_004422 [Alyxoria varia]
MPITAYLSQPDSIVQKILGSLLQVSGSSGLGASGAALISDKAKAIPALSLLYLFITYAASAGGKPRKHEGTLTGLPLRLRSAHLNLMDTFPAYALSAALSYASLTSTRGNVNTPAQQLIVNLLGLHVLLKVFVYLPAYYGDVFPLRGPSHVMSIGVLGAVLWRLAGGGGTMV